ncbi:hypothetical protein HDU76_013356, partial [Blyttiomyces sp. JEL0837]
LYKKVANVDAMIGFLAEDRPAGTHISKTLAVVMAAEFVRKRDGELELNELQVLILLCGSVCVFGTFLFLMHRRRASDAGLAIWAEAPTRLVK